MKRFFSLLLVTAMILSMGAASFTIGATGDPADSYTPVAAPNEDSTLQMWFTHSTDKVLQDDTESTGKDTYSVYMAKNEKQGAQVILYSENEDKKLIKASLSDFIAMDGSGAVIPSQLYYEYYVETSGLNANDIYGLEEGQESIIKEGMTPDAIAPVEAINAGSTTLGKFNLTAGKTQALYYNLTTEIDTPSGWYSATFDVADSSGNIIKTATVFAYVWDFVIPEEVSYQTAFYINSSSTDVYKAYYDYLLENRLVGWNVPGALTADNPYLSNPRVNSFRIANHGSYMGKMTNEEITTVYNALSTMDNWEEVKEKAFFYTLDEPASEEWNMYFKGTEMWPAERPTIEEVNNEYKRISSVWENPHVVVPHFENMPYPGFAYDTDIALNEDGTYTTEDDGREAFANIKDTTQAMMDAGSVTTWCVPLFAYTPTKVLTEAGYNGSNFQSVHLSGHNRQFSGFDITNTNANYFNWDSKFGSYAERINAYQEKCAEEGREIRQWWYSTSANKSYTYANNLIENTGLQTAIIAWQAMQEGVTGYLYYGVDFWAEMGTNNYTPGSDRNYNGSAGAGIWPVNCVERDGYPIYGNGVLMYGNEMKSKLRLRNVDYIGTLRVELLRDGVEEYEMLSMYRDLYGEDAMQKLISKVSDNMACYLSLPLFDTSEFDASMTSDDIFAAVRIELGNAVEKGQDCTEHTWDGGVVVKEPTATEEGEMKYTCTNCGATKTEAIPTVEETLLGDVNDDGKITSKDISSFRNYLAGFETARFNETNADLTKDGKLTSRDLSALRNFISGLDS